MTESCDRVWRIVALSVITLAGACAPRDTQLAASGDTLAIWLPTVVQNVRVFDGTDVIPRATVVLNEGRVAQIALPGEAVVVPDGAVIEEGAGKTLLPGLLDAHTHTFSRNFLKTATAFGVMTHLDMFTDLEFLSVTNEEERSGRSADRPDLFSAGILVTTAGGHGTQYEVPIPTLDDVAEAQEFVDARLAEGSDYIKIVLEDGSAFGLSSPTLDRARLEAAIDAAHARGVLAVVHVGSYAHARMAIEAGADGLVHISADEAPDADFGRWAAQRGVFVVPTLTVMEGTEGAGPAGASLVADPVIGPRLGVGMEQNLLVEFPTRDGMKIEMSHAFEAIRLLHEAGVPVLVGSDAPNPGTGLGPSVHREMELLVDNAGFSPIEALRAATSVTATAFKLEDWRGRIIEGGRADVFLVDGDPTIDILDTRNIDAIWKEGRRWKLELYIETIVARRAEAGN